MHAETIALHRGRLGCGIGVEAGVQGNGLGVHANALEIGSGKIKSRLINKASAGRGKRNAR
jgi:hypothetical protein